MNFFKSRFLPSVGRSNYSHLPSSNPISLSLPQNSISLSQKKNSLSLLRTRTRSPSPSSELDLPLPLTEPDLPLTERILDLHPVAAAICASHLDLHPVAATSRASHLDLPLITEPIQSPPHLDLPLITEPISRRISISASLASHQDFGSEIEASIKQGFQMSWDVVTVP